MQHTFDQTAAARIAARNTPENIRTRLTLRFSLLYLIAFIAGLLLCRALPLASSPALQNASQAAVRSPLIGCTLARDGIRAILLSAKYELILLAALTVSGMTLFCDRACGALTALHGFLCGILCFGIAAWTVRHPELSGELPFFLCFFAQLADAAVLLNVATEAVIFSYRYRDAAHSQRRERDALSVHFILHTMTCAGILIVIATARAILLLAVKNVSF